MHLVEVDHVTKSFRRGEYATSVRDIIGPLFALKRRPNAPSKEFLALDNISFNLNQGDVLALVGANGSGKSTLLKLIARVLKPNSGRILTRGRLSALIELVAGLHPDLTGMENIFLSGAILGMSKIEIRSRLDEIVEFSGLSEFIHTPLKRYSSGMHMRLGFSVAIHVDPDILLLDEILAVGDAEFQKKCYQKVKEMTSKPKGIVLVSHNMAMVKALCNKAILIEKGKMISEGSPDQIVEQYEIRLAEQTTKQEDHSHTDEFVVIHGADFLNHNGVSTRDFETGKPIKILVKGLCSKDLGKVGFVVCVERYDGQRCFLSNSNHQEHFELKKGPFQFEWRIQDLSLIPGTYHFKFAVIDDHYLVDYAMRFGDFVTVTSKTNYDNRYGIYTPSCTWQLSNP